MLAAQVQLLLDGLRSAPPDDFDVGEFVRHCRTLAPIQMLSDQMAQYGNQLQQQLVQLLNSDFEQYISLSVSLQGTETIVIMTVLFSLFWLIKVACRLTRF
jgi:hypothetical protein